MEKNYNESLLDKDSCAKQLIQVIERATDIHFANDFYIYHQFPFYLDDGDSTISANVMLINKYYGVLIFQCMAAPVRTSLKTAISTAADKLDNIHSHIYSKLIKNKALRISPRDLAIDVYPSVYVTQFDVQIADEQEGSETEIIAGELELKAFLGDRLKPEPFAEPTLKEILATIEGSKVLKKAKERAATSDEPNTLGKTLERIENQIAVFDSDQKRAAFFILNGPQRIRGLAGSGKTIILTMKAAIIHMNEPNAEIVYTFWTKSLYDLAKSLITRFYRQFSDRDPNWERIHILHAWGGKVLPGVYSEVCRFNNLAPTTLAEVRSKGDEAFNEICSRLLDINMEPIYDYALLDEAQDFPSAFYKLCLKITKNKRIIWGYDECQNILNIELQDTKKTFGKQANGEFQVDFAKLPHTEHHDLVLHKCYRNERKILVSAFALGLGIYNERIIQLPESKEYWMDLGFDISNGECKTGDKMVITRVSENSPLIDDEIESITIKIASDLLEECTWIANDIEADLKQDLLPEDILVICLDERNGKKYFDALQLLLLEKRIRSFNLFDSSYQSKTFFVKNHITLSTVYRAKGNEAGKVYVLGVDYIYQSKNDVQRRNKLFTALTRAKVWVAISGIGSFAKECADELEVALTHYPNLVFQQPNIREIKAFQRDLSAEQAKFNLLEREIEKIAAQTGATKEQIVRQLGERNKLEK